MSFHSLTFFYPIFRAIKTFKNVFLNGIKNMLTYYYKDLIVKKLVTDKLLCNVT